VNHIQMYASSTQLKQGLQRVLAVSHSLAAPLEAGVTAGWWLALEETARPAARAHRLSLDQLAGAFALTSVQGMCDAARDKVGLEALDHTAVQSAFRAAIISGRAHRAHSGRDVYGASNKGLWDLVCGDFGQAVADLYGPALGEDPVDPGQGSPSAGALDTLRALTEFDTSPDGPDHDTCVQWLSARLVALGFSVEVLGRELGRPLVVARREPRGLAGHVVLYGHYDVTPFGREQKWTHPPRVLTESGGRLFARGVADNKGPLACRLDAIRGLDAAPQITWIIQGEEETGSPVARQLLPSVMAPLRPTLWMDETGYHDHEDGTLRLLGRMLGEGDDSLTPDAALDDLLRGLRGLASRWGVGARHEARGLNKSVVAGGCPYNRSLPAGARYLAIGVNDSAARIHGLNESLPAWTFPLHGAELDVIFRWVGRTAGARS
jgi:hypothetical protein